MAWKLIMFLIGCCTGVILLIFLAIYMNYIAEARDAELFDALSNYEIPHTDSSRSMWSIQPYEEFKALDDAYPA